MDTTSSTYIPDQQPPKKRRSKKGLVITLLVLLAIVTVTYFICGITHREGTHSGILAKVERTGFLFKTYEGEMKITGINEGNDTITKGRVFLFSVEDEKAYRQLEPLQGERATVRFREVLHNFFWQGKTNFFVEGVVEAE